MWLQVYYPLLKNFKALVIQDHFLVSVQLNVGTVVHVTELELNGRS